VDVDPACEYPFCSNNEARFLPKPVEELRKEDLEEALRVGDVYLLAGCAPCQTFSTYNQKATPADKRWWLLRHFAKIVKETSPHIVTMENVPGLEKQDVFREFVASFGERYHVDHWIVKCEDYGIPQRRRRLVLLASRLGPIRLLKPEELSAERSTVRDYLADLPAIEAGQSCESDPFHQASILSPKNLARIRASMPGGSWKDWEGSLVADCHKKQTGRTYPSVYGRMRWDEPAPTITTQFFGLGNGRFGHPEQDRAISLREGAILQGFPKTYRFVPPGKPILKKTLGRLIGNAVPVKLGEVIGLSVIQHVRSFV
jgi:DNA (cytosine-5)-methyltransferase 1